MPASATCATCHTTGTIGENLHQLAELGFGDHDTERSINLCGTCLDQREARAWPLAAQEGQQIFKELNGKQQAPSRRYSYFLEPDENIHLVRLRPEWVDRHAAEA